jgi:hypothetical protein
MKVRKDQQYFWGIHFLLSGALIFSWYLINDKFGFVLTACIAALAIFHNNKINRRRATIDLILKTNSDDTLNEAKKTVAKLSKDELSTLAVKAIGSSHDGKNDPTDSERDQLAEVLEVLNWYEFIAAGVREGAFDYKMFHRLMYGIICRDWKKLHVFVTQLRSSSGSKTTFQEFEWLANDYAKHPLKKN